MRFDITVSDETFDHKPSKHELSKVQFSTVNCTVEDMVNYIQEGRIFSGVYQNDSFHIKNRRKDNFKYSQVISIDIDNSDCQMNDYIATLNYTPTIAYETFSNLQEGKGYRFRFLYVFEDKITSDKFESIYNAVCTANNIDAISNDTSMKSYNQMFYGSCPCCNLICFNSVYTIETFNNYKEKVKMFNPLTNIHPPQVFSECLEHFHDKEFEFFWKTKTDIEVLSSFGHYHTFERTRIEFNKNEPFRNLSNTDYFEITRGWEKVIHNGKEITVTKRVKNHEHRRNKIFLSLVKRRFINPNITLEHLCYAALFELYYFIENTDNKDYITRQQLFKISLSALHVNLSDYKERMISKKSFKVNKDWCLQNGMKVSKVVGMANAEREHKKKIERYELMKKYYNPSLTDKENMNIMNENGIDVKRTTLYKFKKRTKMFNPLNNIHPSQVFIECLEHS